VQQQVNAGANAANGPFSPEGIVESSFLAILER
jgi:hypothetical protein